MAITQVSNSLVKQDLTISGGTVDNTVIGSGTPAAGTFTTVAGTLASTVTGTTAAASDNSTKIATTAYVTTAIANLVDTAPAALNTLNELAAALGDDANFATTINSSIAAKAALAGATFSGDISSPNIKATTEFQIFAGGTDIGAIFNSGGALTIQGTSTRDVSIGSDSNTNAIFIEGSDGNVGIGTNSPSEKLHVQGDGADILITDAAGGEMAKIGSTGSNNGIIDLKNSSHASKVVLNTNGDSYLTGGDVGIGITSPDGTLHVHSGTAGTIAAAAAANELVLESDGPVGMSLLFDDEANDAYGNIYWGNETDGSADGRITYFGSTYVTAADRQNMVFRTAGSEAMRITSSGALELTGDSGAGETNLEFTANSNVTKAKVMGAKAGSYGGTLRFHTTDSSGNLEERIRIDDSGHVGINATPPTNNLGKLLTLDGMNIIGPGSTSGGYVGYNMYYNSAWKYQFAAGSALLSFENGGDLTLRQATTGSADAAINYSETLRIQRSTGYLVAQGASQVRLVLGSTGNSGNNTSNWIRGNSNEVDINTGGGAFNLEINGNKKITVLPGGGITFNGDTAAANALDDYEEGTLTFGNLGGHTNISALSQNYAEYTKVGSLIHIQAAFSVTPTTTGKTSIHFTVPFAMHSASNVGLIGLVTAYPYNTNDSSGYIINYTGANNTQVYVETNMDTATATTFSVQMTYRT